MEAETNIVSKDNMDWDLDGKGVEDVGLILANRISVDRQSGQHRWI